MKKLLLAAVAPLVALGLSTTASAELSKGVKAPQIVTQGAIGGKDFSFNLANELKKGPVVLYFFPKAFTQGCTLEANAFAEAMPEFKAAGANVFGMSADDVTTLKEFSTKECRDAFAVASASPATIKAYDVGLVMNGKDTGVSDRTSYVIAQDGRIVMTHSELDWRNHVSMSLAAVKALKK